MVRRDEDLVGAVLVRLGLKVEVDSVDLGIDLGVLQRIGAVGDRSGDADELLEVDDDR